MSASATIIATTTENGIRLTEMVSRFGEHGFLAEARGRLGWGATNEAALADLNKNPEPLVSLW